MWIWLPDHARGQSSLVRFRTIRRALLLSCTTNFAFWTGALAQVPANSTDSAKLSPIPLKAVVVTARRFSQKLLDVPLPVTAMAGEQLEASRIQSIQEVSTRVPGFKFYEFNVGLPQYFIRGIGTVNRSGAADPAVGVFLDDVYIARGNGVAGQLFDLERIEVLRGPQGTLFGRNAVGGAITVYPRRPSRQFSVIGSATLGNHRRVDGEAVINAPLNDNLAGRLAVIRRSYGGHALNTATGNGLENEDRTAARGSLLYQPDDRTQLLLTLDATRDRSRGNWWHLAVEGPFSTGKANPDPRRGRNAIDGFNRRDDWGTTLRVQRILGTGTLQAIAAYRNARLRGSR